MADEGKSQLKAHGLLLLYAFLISSSFTVGESITQGLSPLPLTFARFLCATLVFAGLMMVRREYAWPTFRDLGRYALIGASIAFYFVAMFQALRWTSAINTGALYTLTPLLTAGISFVLLSLKTSPRQLAFMLIGGVGAVWIVFEGDLQRLLMLQLGKGEAIFLIGMTAFAFYPALVRKFHRGETVTTMTFWVLAMSTVMVGVVGAPQITATAWPDVPGYVYLGVAYLAVFTTAISFYLVKNASLTLPPPKVMSYTYLIPVFVVATKAVLGASLPSIPVLAGLVLTCCAMVLLQRAA